MRKLRLLTVIKAIAPSIAVFIFWGIPLFLIAGTLSYWGAWLFTFTVAIAWSAIQLYLAINDPGLFKKRQIRTENKKSQQVILMLCNIALISGIILSGFDQRYHWSKIPLVLSVIFTLVMIAGFVMLFLVLRQNSYASRTVEIQEEQKLIETGLYSRVRHPMYLSLVIVFLFTPIVLGSWYAFLPVIFIPFFLTFRIKYEEKELQKGLEGYGLYMKKVKYRLFPFIW